MKALQMMRGICILAVIATHVRFDNSMIHANFIIQNIINVAVAGFVFLAGYFVNIDKALENPMRFVGRRFTRIMVPYFAWTFFWWAIDIFVGEGVLTSKKIINELMIGRGPLYFCVVIFYLSVLTPLILKYMDNKYVNIVFWILTPITLVFTYYYQINVGPLHYTGAAIPTIWFVYYYSGIKMQNCEVNLPGKFLFFLMSSGFVAELAETWLLYGISGDKQFAGSPLRIFPFIYIMSFCMLFVKYRNALNRNNMLTRLGDASFGIYLCHGAILGFIIKLVGLACGNMVESRVLIYVSYVIIVTVSAAVLSWLFVFVVKRYASQWFLKMIGFSK